MEPYRTKLTKAAGSVQFKTVDFAADELADGGVRGAMQQVVATFAA